MLSLPSMDSLPPLCALLPSSSLANSYLNCNTPSLLDQLAEPFYYPNPLAASMDLLPCSTISTSSSAPPSKKRKSVHHHLYGDHVAATSSVGAAATYNSDDLEDVLNFLWMDDDSVSAAQSDTSLNQASSAEQFSLLRDLDWDYCSNESSYIAESRVEDPLAEGGGDDQYHQSREAEQAEEPIRAAYSSYNVVEGSWQKKKEGEGHGDTTTAKEYSSCSCSCSCQKLQNEKLPKRGSSWWQLDEQKLNMLQGDGFRVKSNQRGNWQDGIRASWQDRGPRVSWQGGGGISEASWQEKQAARASWQKAPAAASKVESAVPACNSGGVNSDQRAASGPAGGGSWAGPTLLDIESALALSSTSTDAMTCSNNNSSSSTSTHSNCSGPPTPASSSTPTPKHSTIAPFLDVKAILLSHLHGPNPTQQADMSLGSESSWRLKLQKRSSQEPKYSIKVDSEEKALGDGYRWRKYGQKSIKNSPFPRSYYRCSTGKCSAKKQVEKCQEEEGLFLVTYEGIHLHHKPNLLLKLRMAGDTIEEEKEKFNPSEKEKSSSSPCSSTSLSHTIPPHY